MPPNPGLDTPPTPDVISVEKMATPSCPVTSNAVVQKSCVPEGDNDADVLGKDEYDVEYDNEGDIEIEVLAEGEYDVEYDADADFDGEIDVQPEIVHGRELKHEQLPPFIGGSPEQSLTSVPPQTPSSEPQLHVASHGW